MNYVNEFEPFAAAWCRSLIAGGLAPEGVVDERSIADVQAEGLVGYTQCHFFAGILGWPEALRLAGWPADRECWTGSCPCQAFSSAGKRKGYADSRDLWPEFFRLIREARPPVVFGEQVASADVVGNGDEADFVAAVRDGDAARANRLAERIEKRERKRDAGVDLAALAPVWVDRVRADLEGEGYAFRHAVLGAHSAGSPHLRLRVYWSARLVADARHGSGRVAGELASPVRADEREAPREGRHGIDGAASHCRPTGDVAHPESPGGWQDARPVRGRAAEGVRREEGQDERRPGERAGHVGDCGATGFLAHGEGERRDRPAGVPEPGGRGVAEAGRGVGDADRDGLGEPQHGGAVVRPAAGEPRYERLEFADGPLRPGAVGPLGDPDGERKDSVGGVRQGAGADGPGGARGVGESAGAVADADGRQPGDGDLQRGRQHGLEPQDGGVGFWDDWELLPCRDGKYRRIPSGAAKSGLFPLASRFSGRVAVARPGEQAEPADEGEGGEEAPPEEVRLVSASGALRGAGNAIVPQVAAIFIRAFMEENPWTP